MTTQGELNFAAHGESTIIHQNPPESTADKFAAWVRKQGGNWIMQRLFIRAAGYFARYQRNGQRCGIKLLWEEVRWNDLIPLCKSGKIDRATIRHESYAMNNNFHAHAERHLVAHRPEWAAMFEEREMSE